MNNSNEVPSTMHLVYLLQAPNTIQNFPLTNWILNNTYSISSGLAFITLALLFASVQVKANVSNLEKAKRERQRLERERQRNQQRVRQRNLEEQRLFSLAELEKMLAKLQEPKSGKTLPGAIKINIEELRQELEKLREIERETQMQTYSEVERLLKSQHEKMEM